MIKVLIKNLRVLFIVFGSLLTAVVTAQDATDKQVTLTIPGDMNLIPQVPDTTRYVVWNSIANQDGWPFGHSSVVNVFNGRVVVTWYSTTDYEAQDYPRSIKIMVASAPLTDLSNWTISDIETNNPRSTYFTYVESKIGAALTQNDKDRYIFATRGLRSTVTELYLYTLSYAGAGSDHMFSIGRVFKSTDGISFSEIPGATLDTYQNSLMRNSAFNHHVVPLSGGRIVGPINNGTTQHAPITTDLTGLSGWTGGYINDSSCPDPGESAGWLGPDGVIHFAARYLSNIWHAYSKDEGAIYTNLISQPGFTDCPANKEFGSFDNGDVWYIGNPKPGDNRRYLVLGISRNGWHFDETYRVRWEDWIDRNPPERYNAGYDYPSGYYYNGKLYLCYSTDNRQKIELSVVDTASILVAPSLSSPTGLTATSVTEGASLTWNRVLKSRNYGIYRKTGSGGTYAKIADAYTKTYVDTSVQAGNTYYYKITAKNSAGTETGYSTEVPITQGDTTTVQLISTKDTFVINSDTADRGSNTSMGVGYGSGDERYCFIEFNVTGTTGKTINSVKLKLTENTSNGSFGDIDFYVKKTTSAWNESVNWINKPTLSDTNYANYTASAPSNGSTIEIPLDASIISGDGALGICLRSYAGNGEYCFNTREASSDKPTLIIELSDPNDPASLLKVTDAFTNPANPGEFIIRWQSVADKFYTMQAATNLLAGFINLMTNIQATPTVNVYTDSVGSAKTKFYRVKLE